MMISHLALIMDGNRRWAKQRSMFPWLGHKQGAQTVEMVIQYCLEKNIPYLSLYTLSVENLQRDSREVEYLYQLIVQSNQRVQEFIKNNVQVRFIGNLDLMPSHVADSCRELEQQTKDCTKLVCSFLICYGGQQEIIAGIEKMIQNPPERITKEIVHQFLWTHGIPDPEIIIRTGGMKRLSNFLLFQAAYSEIRFLDCLWPDLTKEILDNVVTECIQVQKNFGI